MSAELKRDLSPADAAGVPWIGVDFDGTLSTYDGWKGELYVGYPVPRMMSRIVEWLASGTVKVKIFTARADRADQVLLVQDWLEAHGLPRLEVTNIKDRFMVELWDDRAVAVEKNTGRAFSWQDIR